MRPRKELIARLRAEMPDESPIDLDLHALAIAEEVARMTFDELKTEGEKLLEAIDVSGGETRLKVARPFVESVLRELRSGGTSIEHRIWINEERTLLVQMWSSGHAEVATRETPAHTWGPPTMVYRER